MAWYSSGNSNAELVDNLVGECVEKNFITYLLEFYGVFSEKQRGDVKFAS